VGTQAPSDMSGTMEVVLTLQYPGDHAAGEDPAGPDTAMAPAPPQVRFRRGDFGFMGVRGAVGFGYRFTVQKRNLPPGAERERNLTCCDRAARAARDGAPQHGAGPPGAEREREKEREKPHLL
jgi:hypothetical protein